MVIQRQGLEGIEYPGSLLLYLFSLVTAYSLSTLPYSLLLLGSLLSFYRVPVLFPWACTLSTHALVQTFSSLLRHA